MPFRRRVATRLDDGRVVDVPAGRSLLAGLAKRDIHLSAACGGRGLCGTCRCRMDPADQATPAESALLPAADLESGFRLACQHRPAADQYLELPPSAYAATPFSATVTAVRDLAPDIKRVELHPDGGAGPVFRAGQYALLQLSSPLAPRGLRAYSFANPPTEADRIAFLVRRAAGGAVSGHIHRRLRPGHRVRLWAPYGQLCVEESPAPLLCVAGGSGMAPFLSIFADLAASGALERRDVRFVFGARTAADLFELDFWQGLAARFPRFGFAPALSESRPGDGWTGIRGQAHQALASQLAEFGDGRTPELYLCGNPGLIDACRMVAAKRGLPGERIHYDRFS